MCNVKRQEVPFILTLLTCYIWENSAYFWSHSALNQCKKIWAQLSQNTDLLIKEIFVQLNIAKVIKFVVYELKISCSVEVAFHAVIGAKILDLKLKLRTLDQ